MRDNQVQVSPPSQKLAFALTKDDLHEYGDSGLPRANTLLRFLAVSEGRARGGLGPLGL